MNTIDVINKQLILFNMTLLFRLLRLYFFIYQWEVEINSYNYIIHLQL